jgi:hypothetical protein
MKGIHSYMCSTAAVHGSLGSTAKGKGPDDAL